MITKLEELREEKDLTRKHIADAINVSNSIYSRWEKGMDTIPTRRMNQLANYFNVNIDYMLGLSNKRVDMYTQYELNISLISKRVSEIRDDYKETLREFAERLNTSNSTWSAYETGKTLILSSFMLEICQNSNYSVDWILGRSNNKFR